MIYLFILLGVLILSLTIFALPTEPHNFRNGGGNDNT